MPFEKSIFYLFFRVKNSGALHGAFNVNPLYLTHEYSGKIYNEILIKFNISNPFLGLAIDYMVS